MSVSAGRLFIRAMREDDVDRVLMIAGSAKTAPQWPRNVYESTIASAGVPLRVALIAEDASGIVGFAVASALSGQAELESIAVAGEAQKQGVGTALLQGVIGAVKLLGAEEIVLEVRASNQTAASLYARAGFAEVGRRRGYYVNPAEDAVLLRWGLRTGSTSSRKPAT
jgi:[ribosomal protein S18]-alanine N-acetyltransferase